MKAMTWSRDSHGLFDFESKNLTKKRMCAAGPSMYLRSANNEVVQSSYDANKSFLEQKQIYSQTEDDKALIKLIHHNNCLYVESAAHYTN